MTASTKERHTAFVGLALLPSQRRILRRAARLEKDFESTWIKKVALREAEKVIKERQRP